MKKLIVSSVALVLLLSVMIMGMPPQVRFTDGDVSPAFPCVLVDAGHGGVDGGAVAADGTVEKDINLAVALKLKAAFQFFGYRVITTRETDISIHDISAKTIRQKKNSDLKNRLNMLETSDAVMMISVHQNMFSQSKYSGTQVFYSGNNEQSKIIAQCIQESVKTLIQPENNRAVKRSTKDIYLLYRANKPAVMVECGFMSNTDELARLMTEEYQKKMAFSVISGIFDYNTLE